VVNAGETKAWNVSPATRQWHGASEFSLGVAWIWFGCPISCGYRSAIQFSSAFWRNRLPGPARGGVGFIWASQLVLAHAVFGAGQRMIVMVKYTGRHGTEQFAGGRSSGRRLPAAVTFHNHVVTNRITRLMDWPARLRRATGRRGGGQPASGFPGSSQISPTLEDYALRNLPPSAPLHSRQWSRVRTGLAFVSLIGLAHAGVFSRYREREQQAALMESPGLISPLASAPGQLHRTFSSTPLNGIATLLRRDRRR